MTTVSEKGLAFVAAREACVLVTYWDKGKLAIGFGDNDQALKGDEMITYDEAIARFVRKSKGYEKMVNSLFRGTDIELKQNHYDALYSLVYNYGAEGLKKKSNVVSLVKLLYEDGNIATQSPRPGEGKIMLAQVGHEIANLKENPKRRRQEAGIFVTGEYGDLSQHLLWAESPATSSAKLVPMPQFLKTDAQ